MLAKGLEGELRAVGPVPPMAGPHRHRELEMNLVLAGRAAYVLGDVRYALRPGSLLWLFPGQSHALVDASRDFAYWLGVFGPGLVARACEGTPAATLAEQSPPGRFCRISDEADRLAELFAGVALARGEAARRQGLAWAILAAWEAFERARPDDDAVGMHPAIARAVAALGEDDASWTLDTLARHVGLSPPYLSALFKAQMGVGLGAYRNRVRLARYERLRVSMGAEAAAAEAGFGSYAQFYRVFRAATGRCPRDRREG